MITHVHVTTNGNEPTANTLRRFTKMVRSTGISNTVKARRYYTRALSGYKSKQAALRRIINGKKYEQLKKLGKIEDKTYGKDQNQQQQGEKRENNA